MAMKGVNIWKLLLGVGLALALLVIVAFVSITVAFNRSLPSEKEYNLAYQLTPLVEVDLAASEGQRVYFKPSRGRVYLHVYGVLDTPTQDRILARLRAHLEQRPFEGHVYLTYFPPWKEIRTRVKDGVTEGTVVRQEPLKKIQIQ